MSIPALGAPTSWEGAPLLYAWPYKSTDGETIYGWVARYATTGKRKKLVPFFTLGAHGWEKSGPRQPYPLFGLDTLGKSDTVYIVEGERCAAALQSLGFACVTSQGGSSAAGYSDWSPLSGKALAAILPDNDEAGEAYAQDVEEILTALPEPPRVTRVLLPCLQRGEDVVDWLMHRLPEWNGFAPLGVGMAQAAMQHLLPALAPVERP